MYGEFGNAAEYVHLFYVLSCVERYVELMFYYIHCISWTITHSELKCTVKQ
jgi:hypothetical protein